MVSNIDQTKTDCADFTYVIKVSNTSENDPLLGISKNEAYEKK